MKNDPDLAREIAAQELEIERLVRALAAREATIAERDAELIRAGLHARALQRKVAALQWQVAAMAERQWLAAGLPLACSDN